MRQKKLLWQFFRINVLLTVAIVAVVGWYTAQSFQNFYYDQTKTNLETRARLFEHLMGDNISLADSTYLNQLSFEVDERSGTRITIIDTSGIVIADSRKDPFDMDNHANRPEILTARQEGFGSSVRYSNTLQKRMMYVALPYYGPNGELQAIVRTAMAVTDIDEILQSVYIEITLSGMIIALIAAGLHLLVSRRFTRLFDDITEGLKRFTNGDLSYRFPVQKWKEISPLTESMNQMASQLNDRINRIIHQRNEQEALLTNMVEGVLAVDLDYHIISMNQAAATLFSTDRNRAQGRILSELIRNTQLQEFVKRVMSERRTFKEEIEIELYNDERILEAQGTILYGSEGEEKGVLVVLHDITQTRRLESVRRDFVANVSHELKTPITAIKGFVETLQDGAINEPDNARHFLGIITRQADNLELIIEDLLTLSRIERENDNDGIPLQKRNVLEVLQAAVLACEKNAADKNMKLELKCHTELTAQINPLLLEQAVVNLIGNAIKYSKDGDSILIEAYETSHDYQIMVQDHGTGIASVHLDRLFERFYRVDKARSRKLGGTGLGLAIVKHIVQAHHGHVSVESVLGMGSTFRIHLPLNGVGQKPPSI